MNKILFTVIAAFLLLSSCGNKDKESEKTDQISTSGQYTCPMHPEVVSDKPGSCSKCGMDLVKKESGSMPENKMESDTSMKM